MKNKERMPLTALCNSRELKDAIKIILNLKRRVTSVYISTMNLHDTDIDKNTFLSMVKLLSSKCKIIILIGENPQKIEQKYSDTASIIKDLILNYNVLFHYKDDIHAKQIIITDKDEDMFFVGTCNFTQNGLNDFYEVGLMIMVKTAEEIEAHAKLLSRIQSKINIGAHLVIVDPSTNQLSWM